MNYRDFELYEDEYDFYMRARFADPGGASALYPGTRDRDCPTCGEPNRLTARDVEAGYQCDGCADALERGF